MAPIGVVILDYGGPQSLADVAPFLRSLLSDREVLPVPPPFRQLLAWLVSACRAPEARRRYRTIGSASPLPQQVRQQCSVLQSLLGNDYKVLPAFLHSAPSLHPTMARLKEMGVTKIVGLPTFPQHSWPTTKACQRHLSRATKRLGMQLVFTPSYPQAPGFISALQQRCEGLLDQVEHVLMVAHGIPARNERSGDPYPSEIRQTTRALARHLPSRQSWSLAFQSRLGPVEWLRPYLEDEIKRLANKGLGSLLLVPISFATENLETLFDLDIQATALARSLGMEPVLRARTPGFHELLLECWATMVERAASTAGWNSLPGNGRTFGQGPHD